MVASAATDAADTGDVNEGHCFRLNKGGWVDLHLSLTILLLCSPHVKYCVQILGRKNQKGHPFQPARALKKGPCK